MVVAIDGSLYRYHPKLHNMMTQKLAELVPETKVGCARDICFDLIHGNAKPLCEDIRSCKVHLYF